MGSLIEAGVVQRAVIPIRRCDGAPRCLGAGRPSNFG
jgi:hypothetical protein